MCIWNKKQYDTYDKSVLILEKFKLPQSLLCTNELNENYVRIPIFSENAIENLQLSITFYINDSKIPETFNRFLTEEEKDILHKMFSMYDKGTRVCW